MKRALLLSWTLLVVGGFFVVEFPNSAWNHLVSQSLWIFSIIVFFATLAVVVLGAIRLVVRVTALRNAQTPAEVPDRPRRTLTVRHVATVIILLTAFVASLLAFIEREIKSSSVYQAAVNRAQSSGEVVRILGDPLHTGWFVTGELHQSSDGSGQARLNIPMTGPRGGGSLMVRARRREGNWRFELLQFNREGSTAPVNLLADPAIGH